MGHEMKKLYPDIIQIDYATAARESEKQLSPLVSDLGIGFIVHRPFEASVSFSVSRGNRISEWAHDFGRTSWAQFCLKLLLSHPTETCMIPAISNYTHMDDNIHAGFGPLRDQQTREKMAHYIEHLGGEGR